MRVLLAVGDETISSTLRHHLNNNSFEVDNNEVLHRNYLEEYVSLYNPEMLIIHDTYLPSDEVGKEQEEEMLRLLEKFRMEYGRNLRVVYLCIRDKNDSFLPQLVARDVLDIFNEMQIDLTRFVKQLEAQPIYSNVSRFGTGLIIPARVVEEEPDETEEEETVTDSTEQNKEGAAEQLPKWMKPVKNPFKDMEIPKLSFPKRKTKPIEEGIPRLEEMDVHQEPVTPQPNNEVLKSAETLPATPTIENDNTIEMDNAIQEEIKQDTSIEVKTVKETPTTTDTPSRRSNRKATAPPKVKEVVRFMSIPFQIVLVGGLYPGAGTTTLASNLAIQLAQRNLSVGFLEYPRIEHPYIFDYLQIHSKDPDEEYLDLGNELAHKTITMRGDRQFWDERGVKWSVNDTRKVPGTEYNFEDMLLHAQGLKVNLIVIDIGTRWEDEAIKKFLSIAEHILLVTDTDPVKLDRVHAGGERYTTASKNIINTLDTSGRPYKIVQMRAHEEMDKSILKHLQHKKPSVSITDIPFKDMQKALFNSRFVYEDKEYQRQWEEDTQALIRDMLPKEMWSLTKRKSLLRFMKS